MDTPIKLSNNKLFMWAKQYANATIAGKNLQNLDSIKYNLYKELVFPESGKRPTKENLMNTPVTSRDVFDEEIFISLLGTNLFEFVKYCVTSSKHGILDFLGIPGLREQEPSIGYDMYMATTLFDKIGEKTYDEAEDLLSSIAVQLHLIKTVDSIIDGQFLDKELRIQIDRFDHVIDEVSMTQAYKSVSDDEVKILDGIYFGI